MKKIINRYIFREISIAFVIILFVMTFVLLMGRMLQIMDLIINKGISVISILHMIVLIMPTLMIFTVPIALLISILIAMGRFSADNEITALKSSGLSLWQMFFPAATASVIAFLITAFMSNFLAPAGNYAIKRLLFEQVTKNATIALKEKTFNIHFLSLLVYADKIPADGQYLEGVFVSDSRSQGEENIIIAKKAYVVADPKLMIVKLRMEDGSIHSVSHDLKNYRKIDFTVYDINLNLTMTLLAKFTDKYKEIEEMTISELTSALNAKDLSDSARREIILEIQTRIATPLACLFFGLLAMPLGIKSHRAVRSKASAVGLVIVGAYYLLRVGGAALVENRLLPPGMGAWIPNIIFAILGAYVFFTSNSEFSLPHTVYMRIRQKSRSNEDKT
jgi:lipopolysaccharide export system permease protein